MSMLQLSPGRISFGKLQSLNTAVSKAGMVDVSQTGKIGAAWFRMVPVTITLPVTSAFWNWVTTNGQPRSGRMADRHINHQDIPLGESAVFIHNAVRGL